MKETNPLSKLFVSVVLLLSFVGFSTTVFAGSQYRENQKMERYQKGEPKINMQRIMRHLSKLDITDEQRASIKALLKKQMETNKPKHQQLKTFRMQMKELKKADTLDEQAVRKTSSQIAQLKSDLMISRHKNRQAVKALLSDEQRQKLEEMKAKRKDRKKEGNNW